MTSRRSIFTKLAALAVALSLTASPVMATGLLGAGNGLSSNGTFNGTLGAGVAGTTQSQLDNSTKISTTQYTDSAVAVGVASTNPGTAVTVATTQVSDTSGLAYINGVAGVGATLTGTVNTALTIDGITLSSTAQSVLVKNDTQTTGGASAGAFNGVYNVTQLQTIGLPPILTRRADYNQPSNINNTGPVSAVSGTANAKTAWILTTQVTAVGTDPLTYAQFSYALGATQTNTLPAANIWIGNGANLSSANAVTGTITLTSTGVTGIQNGTFASAPSIAAPQNSLYYATDIGPRGCLITSDGVTRKPASGCCTIGQSGAPTALASSVSETNAAITTVSGGILSSSGTIRLFALASGQGAAGTKGMNIRISSASGTTTLGSLVVNTSMSTAQQSLVQLRDIWAANSISSQMFAQSGNSGTGPSTAIPLAASVNTASTWYINWNTILASSNDAMKYLTYGAQWCE